MTDSFSVRVDKFLWAVRIYKTRSQATDACKKGHVTIDDAQVKPSRIIKVNEILNVRKNPVVFSYKILDILNNRVGAKLVSKYVLDITSDEELLKLDINDKGGFYYRDRGSGRPTKKERRIIDKITESPEE